MGKEADSALQVVEVMPRQSDSGLVVCDHLRINSGMLLSSTHSLELPSNKDRDALGNAYSPLFFLLHTIYD